MNRSTLRTASPSKRGAKIALLVLGLCLLGLVTTCVGRACADEPTTNSWNLGFSGYSQETYDGEANNDRTRLKFGLVNSDLACGFYTEFDVSKLEDGTNDLKDSNWVQKAWASCRLNGVTIDFGRVFPESGFSTFWPGGIITAKYPGPYPWVGYYAYGVTAKFPRGAWAYSGTVSGRSDLHFDDPGQFDWVEVAGRAKRSFGKLDHVAVAFQFSERFLGAGVDFRHVVGKTVLDGGVFYSDTSSPLSGFLQVEQVVTKVIALHALLEERANGDAVATAGIGLRRWGFYLVGDYEENFNTGTGATLVGLRFNW